MKRFLTFFGIIVLIFVLSVPAFAGSSSATATRGSFDGEISFLLNDEPWGNTISLSVNTNFIVKQTGNLIYFGLGSSSTDFIVYENLVYNSNADYSVVLFDDLTGNAVFEWVISSGIVISQPISGSGYYIVCITSSSNVPSYSITFNSNGGSSIPRLSDQTSIPSNIQTSSMYRPVKSNYTFDGWYLNSSLTTRAIGGSALSANITLYAKWMQSMYSVTYHDGSYSWTDDSGFTVLDSASLSSGLACYHDSTQYTFDGWYYDSNYMQIANVGDTLTHNIDLYAKLVPVISVSENQLVFDTQGGSSVSPIVCDEVPELEDLPETTREGWIFDGWYYGSTGENLIVPGDAVVGTVTVYAHWIGVNHLHLNPNGGDFLGEYITDLSYDYVPEALPRVYRAGYKFLGWYYEDESEVKAGDQITGTVYITAHWEQLDTTGLSYEDGYRQGQADVEAMKSIINSGWSVFYSGFNDFTHSTTIGGITIISLLATIVVIVILYFVAKLFFNMG